MIRRPAVAGMFYPADPAELRARVQDFITGSGYRSDGSVRGIVSPHAGYIYSGAVAGAAFASAPGDVKNVVIIAPTHRFPVPGASVLNAHGYLTPLGTASINREITQDLLDQGLLDIPRAHEAEHAAEVQVPFVQVKWPDASLTVILQGDRSDRFCRDLSQLLGSVLESVPDCLIVISSDLSHYHSRKEAEIKDGRIIQAFLSRDPGNLAEALKSGGEACGAGPMLTLMHYAGIRGYRSFRRLAWDTSASASGDTGAVVGYFAGSCGLEEDHDN